MRILVTGAGGFVGRHLIRELTQNGHEPFAFDLNFSTPVAEATASFTGDLHDVETLTRIIISIKPEACIHLGAISFIPSGKTNPELMFSVNVIGTINVLEAFRKYASFSKILVISSARVYGEAVRDHAIREDEPLAPMSMYAISKAAADLTTLRYAREYNLHTITTRPNNHIGPGQSPRFVVPSFAQQVKSIASGESEPVLKVGNLESDRYFTDVRDVVRAYRLLIENGRFGEAYNISSQNRMKISTVLEKLCTLACIKPEIELDPEKFRPTDCSPLLDISKLQNDTGWKPEIALSDTLRDILAES